MSSSTSTIKLLNLPRLKDNGTNYILYKEWIPNVAISKGLRRVLKVEKQLTLQDAYDQKEAQVHEMMYETISTSTFMQIKNKLSAAAMWKKLTSIFKEKGISTQENLLNKLQNQHCPDDRDIRIHLTNMSRMREELAAMGKSISDDSYATYIRTSLLTSYRPTLETLNIASQMIGKPVSSSLLIQFAAILEVDTPVLKCTSDFQAQAQALAALGNDMICEIVDTGASNHFTGYHERFKNFTAIKPIPIKAADGRTFSMMDKGDYPTQLPMGPNQKPMPIDEPRLLWQWQHQNLE
ncbi:uncharacterized protein ARMOST_11670 [Armillaria ostoyae]|uniref:Retrovirus-related Pol polyprotein from transposon TNT 1-94-like beta-barrel domain-containing protein n=1 Tax=Armillaria ostoyae TaxID=47428 RepID=A0A284RHW0_ARMOS|nr:uncharacterized protein ARMOST_11670 [Armillaria ostoyae]